MTRAVSSARAVLVFFGLSACVVAPASRGDAPSSPRAPSHEEREDAASARGRGADAVVLVAVDGARWQDAFDARAMPYLADLARTRGAAVGAPGHGEIRASGPNFVSLPGYTEMLTGRASACQTNDCARVDAPTLADAFSARGRSAAVFSSWERIERVASEGDAPVVVSAGRADGDRDGPWPGDGAYRPDRATARAALAYLERQRPSFMFLGLGDTDEHAHHGDHAAYLRALAAADDVLAELVATLARMGERGARTAVIVTADHGRATNVRDHGGAFPESSRVWLVALGAGVRARGAVGGAYRLADVAPTVRALAGLAPDQDARAGAPIAALWRAP